MNSLKALQWVFLTVVCLPEFLAPCTWAPSWLVLTLPSWFSTGSPRRWPQNSIVWPCDSPEALLQWNGKSISMSSLNLWGFLTYGNIITTWVCCNIWTTWTLNNMKHMNNMNIWTIWSLPSFTGQRSWDITTAPIPKENEFIQKQVEKKTPHSQKIKSKLIKK